MNDLTKTDFSIYYYIKNGEPCLLFVTQVR